MADPSCNSAILQSCNSRMTNWQRRARLVIAVAAVAFAVVVAFAFRRRGPTSGSAPVARTDPKAVVESATGRTHPPQSRPAKKSGSSTSKLADLPGRLRQDARREDRHRASAAAAPSRSPARRATSGRTNRRSVARRRCAAGRSRDGLVVRTRARDLRGRRRAWSARRGRSSLRAAGSAGSGVGLTYDKNARCADDPRSGRRADVARTRRAPARLEITSGPADVRPASSTIIRFERGDEGRARRPDDRSRRRPSPT